MKKILASFLCLFFLWVSSARALEVVSQTTLASGFYDIYSPATVRGRHMYLGGWRFAGDNNWRDLIFKFNVHTQVLTPRLSSRYAAFNDPSIVAINHHLLMYFTWGFEGVGIAESSDHGKNWYVIGQLPGSQSNGIDNCVGGSPGSALVRFFDHREIWVFWHGQYISPEEPCWKAYWQRFEEDGISPLSPVMPIDPPIYLANIDVAQRPDGTFLMAADFPLRLLESDDGFHWRLYHGLRDGVLLPAADPDWNITPHLADVTNDSFTLYFSHTTCICWDAINNRKWSLHKWTFAEN